MTLNKIISRLRSLATSHKQINYFYYGEEQELEQYTDVQYPALFVTDQPGTIDKAQKLQTFNFRFWFLDRVGVSAGAEENEQDVKSDTAQVAADLIAMLGYYEDDWIVSSSNAMTLVTEKTNDMVGGCFVDVGVSIDFLSDRCQVPVDDITFETEIDMARTRLLTYTGTGVEGDSFTVPLLAGKIVLAAYRATDYKRVITTVPTVTDKIQVVGTDIGDRKGILSTTGVVSLVSGDALMDGEILDFLIIE